MSPLPDLTGRGDDETSTTIPAIGLVLIGGVGALLAILATGVAYLTGHG